eukprot:Plantae.Rhodophyta-Hildenbrandia_rubra.ctg25350.p1 GENE.Plantae.Rhodophyta-Hildenbrandia_rubra.ctg25350~~Plantae.Rhodophyta-Hildenbrandia_rubra.ctg25350.p1  ORF type:complete len:259 (-),score=32.10 Plantae.Rhodophyta-Hildenbrandia_rubra.ctg25350:263-1039(-)
MQADAPFLIGLPALIKRGSVISAVTQTARMMHLNRVLKGFMQSNRFYAPLSNDAQAPEVSLISFTEVEAKRLHHHFKHASADGKARALKNAGCAAATQDRKLLQQAVDNCAQCVKYSSLPWRPVVAHPHPTICNDRLAMGLLTANGLTALHIVCLGAHCNRLAPVTVLRAVGSESSRNAFELLYCFWINQMGLCNTLIVDQGKNFASQELHYHCEAYGIRLRPAPANSPWSNGVCEVFIFQQNELYRHCSRKLHIHIL